MQARPAWLVLWAVIIAELAAAAAETTQSNPLGKVVQLLNDLAGKVRQDGEAEKKTYHRYFEWCDGIAKSTEYEVETASAVTSKLKAKIDELDSSIQVSVSKIEDLASAISTSKSELETATVVRRKEASEFKASESELIDSVDILGRALSVLEREMQKSGGAAFPQLDSSNMAKLLQTMGAIIDAASFASEDRQKLLALAQTQAETSTHEDEASDSENSDFGAGGAGAPEADAYRTHSAGIMDVLEDMREKAEAQLAELRNAEGSATQNFKMVKQSLEHRIDADNQDMDDEKKAKAEAEGAKATAQGDLEVSSKELKNQKKALATVKSQCIQIAADHEKSVRDREGELQTLAKATQILQETTGGAEEKTYSFVQVSASKRRKVNYRRSEVVTLVKGLAKEHHSAALSQLSARIVAVLRYSASNGDDPFEKVRGLITTLITKLENEASSEEAEKAYCDEEMAKTAEKIGNLNTNINEMTTKIDQSQAKSTELKRQVAELQKELAVMAEEEQASDTIRKETHESFVATKADLEEGLTGVQKAVAILRDYYSNDDEGAAASASAASASLVQQQEQRDAEQQPTPPQNHEKASGAGGSVISILEVVQSDFARNLASAEEEESDAQASYEKEKQDLAVTRTEKLQDVKYKTQEYVSLDKTVADISSDLETSNSELAAVMEYDAKVKNRCVAKPDDYAARKTKRQAEINGLKEALTMLENDVAFLQYRGHKHRDRHVRGKLALDTP